MIERTYYFQFADRAEVFGRVTGAIVLLGNSRIDGVRAVDANHVVVRVNGDEEVAGAVDGIAESYEGRLA